eukprot:TRINITY_DN1037_c0_g1_i1.p1 TRINITY_DN1037_c0_g1~~TRINITY_DN1037_c0_g1_i1.p1  ORF type:complete len:142 (-),score=23.34 TRINITY_DN1037_c0_g1_i1:239-664(-)
MDTAGQEELASVRKLSYHGAHVFLVCFSIASPTSYENVEKWVQDIREFDVTIPFVIVGTQMDLRDSPDTIKKLSARNMSPVTFEQGLILQRKFNAAAYVECSALTRDGLGRVFNEAVSAILTRNTASPTGTTTQTGCCCVL